MKQWVDKQILEKPAPFSNGKALLLRINRCAVKFYDIPATYDAEIEELEHQTRLFRQGIITARELKAHRVPFGVYAQRSKDTYMIRIRCTGGGITPHQLRAVAELSSRYGADFIHFTTRQGLQIHDVVLENVVAVIRKLKEVGLSTRGGGGNTVRNIMVSWDAGISPKEVFDVTPYAVSLTSRLIAEPDSWLLPRKFKISFSNSDDDNANACLNDLGFVARIQDGIRGFKVYVSGGLGLKPQVAEPLHDFISADQVYVVAESVKRVFSRYGSRKNKHAARLRFLRNRLGREEFEALYHQELQWLEHQQVEPLEIKEMDNRSKSGITLKAIEENCSEFATWKKRYVTRQKQPNLYAARIPLFLGNLKNEHAVALADFLSNFGDNVMRCTMDQNLSVRNIPEIYLGNLFQVATAVSDLSGEPRFVGNWTACTGADTCTLGICLSQGALRELRNRLKPLKEHLDDLADIKLHTSGCPNTCGMHACADLGFYGRSARNNNVMYPEYHIVAGAVAGDTQARLARKIDRISARNLPDFVVKFLDTYRRKKPYFTSFAAYIDDCGAEDIRAICNRYRDIPDIKEDKTYYIDWGAAEEFSLVGMGMGECSAGLFDLIEVDRDMIRKKRRELESLTDLEPLATALYQITLAASRMLLITRGVEVRSDQTIFDAFDRHFIRTGLVDVRFRKVLQAAENPNGQALVHLKPLVYELAQSMEELYQSMDDALQFPEQKKMETILEPPIQALTGEHKTVELFRDYRGVACPMNFVKVKLDLAAMAVGQILTVLLDDGEPIENVPGSVAEEGHEIVEQKKTGDHWTLRIRKA
ncbi:MAG: sulfurtransferase TusA family protein [Deltaproteobacteria bacterium]|nr:sulfurtransferase TusA family protein [Deltaproteobacteria bacterium]MBW2152424.1 sulfurtransferase TusA family protein [Deltaproteobacteria bacterium]